MSTLQLAVPLAKSGEAVKAGPIGLVVILVLCIACYFLFKSMSKHLKTVRDNFPSDEPPAAADTDQAAGSTAVAPPDAAVEPDKPAQPSAPPPPTQ
jgi:hypothetical protein